MLKGITGSRKEGILHFGKFDGRLRLLETLGFPLPAELSGCLCWGHTSFSSGCWGPWLVVLSSSLPLTTLGSLDTSFPGGGVGGRQSAPAACPLSSCSGAGPLGIPCPSGPADSTLWCRPPGEVGGHLLCVGLSHR